MAVDPPLPPDRRTEPLVPARPVRERVVAGAPLAGAPVLDAGELVWLADTVRFLRTALALVGLLSFIALAVAIYAVTKAGGDTNGPGASRARVARLDDRLTRLSRQLQSTRAGTGKTANATDLEALKQKVDGAAKASDLQSLRATVTKLSTAVSQLSASSAGGGADPQAALTTLGQRIDRLDGQVQALEQGAGQGTP